MMTPRENVLEVINWGKPEYVPLSFECFKIIGILSMPFIEAPLEPGPDAFGVNWLVTPEGAIPDSSSFILDDICNWEKIIKFPDIGAATPQIHEMAKIELADVDRSKQMTQLFHDTGLFERLAAFMGFENALIAMVIEPEKCAEFFSAMADYKVKCINALIDAYQPDIFCYYDDVATARGLFMSPDTWRELIKPYHARIVKAVTDRGVIFQQHICGLCEDILEDYVEMGVTMWHTAQIMNDIPGIQERFRGRLIIEGGWDSSGRPGMIDATGDEIRAEVRREIEAYGKNGGFIMSPMMMNERGNAAMVGDDRIPALMDEWEKHCAV